MDKQELEALDKKEKQMKLLDAFGNGLMILLFLGGLFFITRGIWSFNQTRANVFLIALGIFMAGGAAVYLYRQYQRWRRWMNLWRMH